MNSYTVGWIGTCGRLEEPFVRLTQAEFLRARDAWPNGEPWAPEKRTCWWGYSWMLMDIHMCVYTTMLIAFDCSNFWYLFIHQRVSMICWWREWFVDPIDIFVGTLGFTFRFHWHSVVMCCSSAILVISCQVTDAQHRTRNERCESVSFCWDYGKNIFMKIWNMRKYVKVSIQPSIYIHPSIQTYISTDSQTYDLHMQIFGCLWLFVYICRHNQAYVFVQRLCMGRETEIYLYLWCVPNQTICKRKQKGV
jgi:hypothetical protein